MYTGILNSTVENNFTRMYGKTESNADLLEFSDVHINIPFKSAFLNDVRYCFNSFSFQFGRCINVYLLSDIYVLLWLFR